MAERRGGRGGVGGGQGRSDACSRAEPSFVLRPGRGLDVCGASGHATAPVSSACGAEAWLSQALSHTVIAQPVTRRWPTGGHTEGPAASHTFTLAWLILSVWLAAICASSENCLFAHF